MFTGCNSLIKPPLRLFNNARVINRVSSMHGSKYICETGNSSAPKRTERNVRLECSYHYSNDYDSIAINFPAIQLFSLFIASVDRLTCA